MKAIVSAGWLVLVIVMLIGMASSRAPASEERTFLTPAFAINETTVVPVRIFGEWIGAMVESYGINTVITLGKTRISLNVGSRFVNLNGEQRELVVAPRIIKDLLYVPARFIGESIDAVVEHEPVGPYVVISTKEKVARFEVKSYQQTRKIYKKLSEKKSKRGSRPPRPGQDWVWVPKAHGWHQTSCSCGASCSCPKSRGCRTW